MRIGKKCLVLDRVKKTYSKIPNDYSFVTDNQTQFRSWGKNDLLIIKSELDRKINLESLLSFTNNLEEKDVVYFCKSSITPRSKLKDYYDRNNFVLNKTNRIEYANTFVLNKEDVITLKNSKEHEYWEITDIDIFERLKIFSIPLGFDKIYLNRDVKEQISFIHGKNWHNGIHPINLVPFNNKYASLIDILEVYVTNPKKYKIIYDQTISQNLNTFKLDLDMFKHLDSMLSSTSGDDHNLAAGIISNCDREENKIQILLLLNKFYHVLSPLRQSNLDIKLLMEYFKSYAINLNWEDFLRKILILQFNDETKIIFDEYMLRHIQFNYKHLPIQISDIRITIK